MPLPKIEFCDSWIYDDQWRYFYQKLGKEYPAHGKLPARLRRLEKAWQKDGDRILREMEKATGLRWQEKKIQCFVVGRMVPFSFPLTIMVEEGPIERTVDILTHELIHQLFVQNDKGGEAYGAWAHIHRKYKKEPFNTRIHIPVHAVHHRVLGKLFGEKRLEREMASLKGFPEYERAWEIVLEEGAEEILAEFRERVGK